MELADWAEDTARTILQVPLPRRWAHTQGVAAQAWTLKSILGKDADLLAAAAWLHDIGYAPDLVDTGFHPLDGARYLGDTPQANELLCRLVAHHSCAVIEAAQRGLDRTLLREFAPIDGELADALTYCDMTTGPDGQRMSIEQRLEEIRSRYAPDHPVSRTLDYTAPELTRAVRRVQRRLTRASSASNVPPAVRPLVLAAT
jgi:HD superfamily phosphodiesterase